MNRYSEIQPGVAEVVKTFGFPKLVAAVVRIFGSPMVLVPKLLTSSATWMRVVQSVLGFALLLIASSGFADQPLCIVSLSGDQRLEAFAIADGGKLTLKSKTPVEFRPGTSTFDATGRNLYVAGSDPDGISVFRVAGSRLTHLQTVTAPAKPSFLSVTPSGRFLLAAYYQTGQVTVHRIVGEGRISNQPIQILKTDPRAHGIAVDPSERFVFVPHTSVSRISQFRFDAKSGKLSANSPAYVQRAEGVAPRHLWFHPTANLAVGSNEAGRSISIYRFNDKAGTLTEIQTLPSMPEIEGRATTSDVEFHPSGKFAFIANRGHGSIASFSVDEKTGAIELLERVKAQPVVRSFNISSNGRYLVAAGQKSGKLLCFTIAETSKLTRTDEVDAGKNPWWVSFAPARD